jgi:hypothetical protein
VQGDSHNTYSMLEKGVHQMSSRLQDTSNYCVAAVVCGCPIGMTR